MPTFSYTNTFADAATSDADDVMENISKPATTPVSLDIINGQLDATNKDTGDDISRDKAQPFSFAHAKMVGATANLDFIEDRWWQGVDLSGGDADQQFIPIPGASISYYLPYNCTMVLICWQISWGSDADAAAEVTPIKLFTGIGSSGAINSTRRQTSISVVTGVRYGKNTDQWYAGHHTLLAETAGWKHASLRICSDAEQVRVRVRNMIVIPLR
jgi:hypothetical protein